MSHCNSAATKPFFFEGHLSLTLEFQASSIETLITSFMDPLPALVDSNDRVHCSLNLNTETGRLSARKPNLQVL